MEFSLNGRGFSLTAFPGHEPGGLSVLFTDATSGVATYAADLATCPLSPAGNRPPVAVEAGEKIPYERR